MTRRPRHPRTRALLLILAIVALVTAIASPVDAASPKREGGKLLPARGPARSTAVFNVPNGVVGFKSYLGWVYDDNSIAVVGEVLNNTEKRAKAIGIKITYFSNPDSTVALGSTSDTVLIDGVARGALGPFVVYEPTPPAGVGAYTIEITGYTLTSTAAGGGLDLTFSPSYVTSGVRYYPGTIKNSNAFAVDSLRVVLTAYDAAGNVGEVMPDEPTGPVAAGGSVAFLIGISADFGPDFTMAKVKFLADGYRSDQPTVYVTSWANYFDDIAGNTFKDDIVWMAENAVTKGCGPGKYCPDSDVRRDEMASFLARALGLSGAAPNAFTDDEGNTHEKNINLVAQAGITTGCGPSLYCPTENVKRDQMASFLARALGLSGTAPNAFTDDEGNTHEKNINLVAQAGVTTGCSASKYCPKDLVTRGQMAAFLRRAFD